MYKRQIIRRKAAERKVAPKHERLGHLELSLARATKVRPNPSGRQKTDKPALRKKIRKLERKVGWLDKKLRRTTRKAEKVRDRKQSLQRKPTRARIAKRIDERQRAEARLASAIARMTAHAKGRVGGMGAASGKGFSKPVKGPISQDYGCTGFRTNPRRGSCRHFHDGVDITGRVGTKVRASADGYVAFVGFNPADDPLKRAFIVKVVHAGGYVSTYAHLKPTRKVKAGQRVDRGDVVGTIGMTGKTTGPHVHWEIYQGVNPVDPLMSGR